MRRPRPVGLAQSQPDGGVIELACARVCARVFMCEHMRVAVHGGERVLACISRMYSRAHRLQTCECPDTWKGEFHEQTLWACQPSFCTDGSGPLFGTINLGLRDLQMHPEGPWLGCLPARGVRCGCVSKGSSHEAASFPEITGRVGPPDWMAAQRSVTNILSTAGASGARPCSDGSAPFPLAVGETHLVCFKLLWETSCPGMEAARGWHIV